MKKKLTVLFALILVFTTIGCSKTKELEGGENNLVSFEDSNLNITTNDLYEILKEKYGISYLIELIDTKILNQEYETDNSITDYADIQIKSIKNYYSDDEKFLEYINSYGYQDEDELREYFILNYKRNLVIYDYLESTITDKEINQYYEDKISGDITGSHILIEANITDDMTEDEISSAKQEAYKKALEAIEKLNNGESFENVAKDYSTDSLTSSNGGKMGTFNQLDLDDVTKQEFNKLEVSGYSTTPIETEYGYEIFYKENEKEKPSLDEVKSKIIEILSDEKLTSDSKLQYKGLMNIREKYGFKIEDEDLELYYENTMNNLLKSE